MKTLTIPIVGDYVRDKITGQIFQVTRRTKRSNNIYLWNEEIPNALEICEPYKLPAEDDWIGEALLFLDMATEAEAEAISNVFAEAYAEPDLKRQLWGAMSLEQKQKIKRFAAIAGGSK